MVLLLIVIQIITIQEHQGDNIAVANNSFVGTPRVEGLDARTNALLDYFRR